jgi:hypothetical protein
MSQQPDGVEIMSPPYPDEETTVEGLHQMLCHLYDFVECYREGVNQHYPDCLIAKPRVPAAAERHAAMPVTRLARLFAQMRSLRCAWDVIVRLFERNWHCQKALEYRHGFFHHAAAVTDLAHASEEVIEHKKKQADERERDHHLHAMACFFAELDRQIQRGGEPPKNDEEEP